jgi:hypothetical protein
MQQIVLVSEGDPVTDQEMDNTSLINGCNWWPNREIELPALLKCNHPVWLHMLQAFQMPLPKPLPRQPNWSAVRADIVAAMTSRKRSSSPVLLADTHQGKPHLGAQFATVAFQCASTFRATDFLGGCNGARIRFDPQKNWPVNSGLVEEVIKRLQPVKSSHPDLSWADLLVLAGTVAVEQAAGVKPSAGQTVAGPFSFCPGRSDADSGAGMEQLAPRSYSTPEIALKDNAAVMGLTAREAVALAARPRR